MIRKIIQEFGRIHITPFQKKWDEVQSLPDSLFKQLGKLGMMGGFTPKKYGGLNLTLTEYMAALEAFSELDAAISLSLLAHNSLCMGHIMSYGNEAQQAKWLPKLASGAWIGAWALTEPESGSDVSNLQTVANQRNDGWLINGKKHFITNGHNSSLIILIARTPLENNPNCISSFVVKKVTKVWVLGKEMIRWA